MDINGKRIFIRNIDKTDEIKSLRILPHDKIGVVFKTVDFEFKYNKENVKIRDAKAVATKSESDILLDGIMTSEQTVLDSISNIIKHDRDKFECDLRHSRHMGSNYIHDNVSFVERALSPYDKLLVNPYFAKFRFKHDPVSYYVSEHNVNRLPLELNLPENVQIISVYSDLGKNIYNRRKSFRASPPTAKRTKLYDDYEVYFYNDSSRLDQSTKKHYDVAQKYRFNIRNNKIIGLSDETPR